MGRSGNPAHKGFQGAGIKVEAQNLYRREVSDPGPGKHLWTVIGMWRIDPVIGRSKMLLDTENLLTIEGPGCFKCEKEYTAELAGQPCPGSVDG